MVYQCLGQRSSIPWLIRDAGMAIWSIEELCYYIKENMFMLDPTFLDGDLVDFIRGELCLPDLAEKLFVIQRNGGAFADFVETLFRETCYVTESELGTIRRALSVRDALSAYEKHRIRGDFLMKCGRIAPAVLEYRASLDSMDESRMPREAARILHNIGVAYVSMFLFEKAAEYFERACELDPGATDTREQLLFSKRLSMSGEEYRAWVEEQGFDSDFIERADQLFEAVRAREARRGDARTLDSLLRKKEAGDMAAWKSGTAALLAEWKTEYRRN